MATTGTSESGPPDAGPRAALEHGWGTFKEHFWILLAVSVLAYVIQSVGTGLQVGLPMAGASATAGAALGVLWSIVVGTPIGAGLQYTYLRAARQESPEVGDLFSGFPRILSLIGASILTGIATLLGLLLLIIPGIYVGLRLAFVPLLVVDRDVGALDAINECWDTMPGHILDLLLFVVASFFVAVGGFLLLIVGLIPAGIWIFSSYASFYRTVFDEEDPGTGEPGGLGDEPERIPEPEDTF